MGLTLKAWLPLAKQLVEPTEASRTSTAAPHLNEPLVATAVLLARVFAGTWFISTAIAAHLPSLLAAVGAAPGIVVAIAALVGPAQVARCLL